jgi:hypothetical protein
MLFNNIRLSFCLSASKLNNKMADKKRLRASVACHGSLFPGTCRYRHGEPVLCHVQGNWENERTKNIETQTVKLLDLEARRWRDSCVISRTWIYTYACAMWSAMIRCDGGEGWNFVYKLTFKPYTILTSHSRVFRIEEKPYIGPTQLRIHWVLMTFPSGVKWQCYESNHPPPSSTEVKNGGVITPLPHTSPFRGT